MYMHRKDGDRYEIGQWVHVEPNRRPIFFVTITVSSMSSALRWVNYLNGGQGLEPPISTA